MDGLRFDDLTRTLASSRRGMLRALVGVAGGLISLRRGTDATSASPPFGDSPAVAPPRPPRRGGCANRPDGARCGQCGSCQAGTCATDDARCRGCKVCDPVSLACVPVAEGEPCGNRGCLTCQGGECRAGPDDEPCGGNCGYCLNGFCEPYDEECEGECSGCDAGTFTCGPVREGLPCGGGVCGACQGGVCETSSSLCDLFCEGCDPDTLTCTPFPDGRPCGLGECGACEGGRCLGDNDRCDSDCAICAQQGDSFTCIPAVDGSSCGGGCGVCQLGLCEPDPGRCNPDCEICDPNSLDCIPANEGSSCGICLTCRSGVCLPASEGAPCGAECGSCEGRSCVPNFARCDLRCETCDSASLTCVPANEGAPCSGECGACQHGACNPNGLRCPEPECQTCHSDTLTCQPAFENESCDSGRGLCRDGTCAQCYWGCCHANSSGVSVGPAQCCTEVCSTCVLPGQSGFPGWDITAPGACLRWRDGFVGGYCEEIAWQCGVIAPPCYVNGVAVACCGFGFTCGPEGCERI